MKLIKTWLFLMTVLALSLTGCQDAEESSGDSVQVGGSPATIDDHGHNEHDGHDHGHAHQSEGPHHGDLVELGNEEYHGEVVHNDDSGTLEIYILDDSAKKQVAIDATEVIINLLHDGQPEQFALIAKPDQTDDAGRSSRFVSDDSELADHLHDADTSPVLVVRINGKSYRGEISHHDDHEDHEDHGHDHDDHDHDNHEGT